VFVAPELAQGPAKLAVIGEYPTRGECESPSRRIASNGGVRMLLRGLRHQGLGRADVHWSNAVLCDCAPKDLAAARKACAPRLAAELTIAAPPAVLALGTLATQSAMQSKRSTPVLKWRGSVSQVSYAPGAAPTWVLPTLGPTFVQRAPKWGRVLEIDVARLARVRRDGFTPPEEQEGRKVIVARTEAELAQALAQAPAEDSGFDVETVGLGPTATALVCFALSDGMTTIVVPWSTGRDGRDPWWPRPARVAAMISAHWATRRVITHNGPAFDHIVARRYGLRIREWGDTLIAAHATEPWLPKGLSHVVTMGVDVAPWKQLEDRTATIERLWTYNARDSLYMMLRWFQLREQLT
jgi:uracil-DNA glycosylase family 4